MPHRGLKNRNKPTLDHGFDCRLSRLDTCSHDSRAQAPLPSFELEVKRSKPHRDYPKKRAAVSYRIAPSLALSLVKCGSALREYMKTRQVNLAGRPAGEDSTYEVFKMCVFLTVTNSKTGRLVPSVQGCNTEKSRMMLL